MECSQRINFLKGVTNVLQVPAGSSHEGAADRQRPQGGAGYPGGGDEGGCGFEPYSCSD